LFRRDFFGVAVSVGLRWLIYLGVLGMVVALLLTARCSDPGLSLWRRSDARLAQHAGDRRVAPNSSLALYALVLELTRHSEFGIRLCLLLLCFVAQLTRPELELGNDMRILTGHDNHSLRVEHVRY
jgi:hypothetical protein